MDQARAAIAKFISRKGHRTVVEEIVQPAVTNEIIKPTRRETIHQAVDREFHQHHYHTTVQPVVHKELLPAKESHNLLPVEHREFHHDNEVETKKRLALEAAKFRDSKLVHETQITRTEGETATGEHVHHYVHEIIQPIVFKEIIQPEVIHTTVPIHETHYGEAQHYTASLLPIMTLQEFLEGGASLTGRQSATREEYEGQPRPYNAALQTDIDQLAQLGYGESMVGQQKRFDSGPQHKRVDSGVSGVDWPIETGGRMGARKDSTSSALVAAAPKVPNVAMTRVARPPRAARRHPQSSFF